MKHILFVDHQDSFSMNIVSEFRMRHCKVTIVPYTSSPTQLSLSSVDLVVLSPGPGHPSDYPHSLELISACVQKGIPVLGICLGFQQLMIAANVAVGPLDQSAEHGRVCHMEPTASCLLPQYRYEGGFVLFNSLGTAATSIDELHRKGWNIVLSEEVPFILAAEHFEKRLLGVQFHPESFASTGCSAFFDAVTCFLNA